MDVDSVSVLPAVDPGTAGAVDGAVAGSAVHEGQSTEGVVETVAERRQRALRATRALAPIKPHRAPKLAEDPAEELRVLEIATRQTYLEVLKRPEVMARLQHLLTGEKDGKPILPDKQWLEAVSLLAKTFFPARPIEAGGAKQAVQVNITVPRPEAK